jgi:hypothetical protein
MGHSEAGPKSPKPSPALLDRAITVPFHYNVPINENYFAVTGSYRMFGWGKGSFQREEFFYGMRQQRRTQRVYRKKSQCYAVQLLGQYLLRNWGMTGQRRRTRLLKGLSRSRFMTEVSCCIGGTHANELVRMVHAVYQSGKEYRVPFHDCHDSIRTANGTSIAPSNRCKTVSLSMRPSCDLSVPKNQWPRKCRPSRNCSPCWFDWKPDGNGCPDPTTTPSTRDTRRRRRTEPRCPSN